MTTTQRFVTGLNAFAFGFGLKEDALTFKRAADVGEVGASVRGVTAEDPELLPLAGVALAEARVLAPLKAGMGWMTMLIDGFPGFAVSVDGFEAAGGLTGAGMTLVAADGAAALRPSGPALAILGWATTGRVALGVGLRMELVPIVRACVEVASLEAFSRICFCFSSSFARIGTKSSGMGLLSYGAVKSCWPDMIN